MSESTAATRIPKLTRVALTELGRKPRGCPDQVKPSWARLQATYKSVSGLFDTLHVLREKAAETKDARGRLSEDQLDQVRAAIVFTSAGLDACLRRLLRDALPALIEGGGKPQGRFKGHIIETRLIGNPAKETKAAITDPDPRTRLIELYVEDLAGSSLQGYTDLIRVRDALGLTDATLADEHLEALKDFFAARNEIAHELDLLDPTGRGDRGRRHRDMGTVGNQCDRVIHVIEDFLRATASALKAL
ncbi:hypothetical protein [Amycolatopsis aidingensis]|uniref:hypothetical protein n=1 Tax=Amycolatopsis aidingensis TaxID=2842453 RepID=UPI001C0C4F07|nr:hypothetical protein [Amycolatopsis aidingensis]